MGGKPGFLPPCGLAVGFRLNGGMLQKGRAEVLPAAFVYRRAGSSRCYAPHPTRGLVF